jgi:thiol-disulfide isomerase/thioredoxin
MPGAERDAESTAGEARSEGVTNDALPGARRGAARFGVYLVLAVLGGWLAFGGGAMPALPAEVPLGSQAPEVAAVETWVVPRGALLPLRRGSALSSSPGEVLLIEFWATWCPPCRATHPLLDELAAEFGPRGLRVVGVTIPDAHQTLEDIRRYVSERGFPSAVLSSPEALTTYGVETLPYALVVDGGGTVVWRGHPLADEKALRSAIDQALEGAKAPRGRRKK